MAMSGKQEFYCAQKNIFGKNIAKMRPKGTVVGSGFGFDRSHYLYQLLVLKNRYGTTDNDCCYADRLRD